MFCLFNSTVNTYLLLGFSRCCFWKLGNSNKPAVLGLRKSCTRTKLGTILLDVEEMADGPSSVDSTAGGGGGEGGERSSETGLGHNVGETERGKSVKRLLFL